MTAADNTAAVALPRETVPSAPLGGEVIVQGPLLSTRLTIELMFLREREPRSGESAEEAVARASVRQMLRTLSACVLGADGQPLKTLDEWDVFGGAHPDEASRLFNVAERLAGRHVGELEKN